MSCADFERRSLKQLRPFQLMATEGPHACLYRATVSERRTTVLSIKESHPTYPMTAQLAKSRKEGVPIISSSDSSSGKATLLYVSKGVTLKYGKTTTPASRDLEVLLAHESLGLTAKQGRQLAIRVAMGVQGPRQPPSPSTAD